MQSFSGFNDTIIETISITLPSSQSWEPGHKNGGESIEGQGIAIDNSHIVIPLMVFVFGFPVIVIGILCAIQQRNKCLAYRHQQEHRGSITGSTMYSAVGTNITTPRQKASIASSVVDMNAILSKRRESVALCVFPEVSPDSSGCGPEAPEAVAEKTPDQYDQENDSAAKHYTDV